MNNRRLLEGPVLKSILIFALPLLISNIFQQLYNTVDTIIIGNHLGEMSLAALGASMAVFQLLVGFALGFGNGFGIVTARHYGAGDNDHVKSSVASSLIIGLLVSGLVMLISHLFLDSLLRALRTPEEILGLAHDYIYIITMFVGIMFMYNLCASMLRAIGNSFIPLVFLIISSFLNIFLDILFVVYLGYGIKGAAIATVIAQGVSVILSIGYITLKVPLLIPRLSNFKPEKKMFTDLIGQGASMALMSSFVIIGTVILQYAINDMGYLIIAGHTIARRIHSLLLLPIAAIVMSVPTFVSQNKGAGNSVRLLKGVRYSFMVVAGWGLVAILLTWLLGPLVIKLLSGSEETLLLTTGDRYLRFNTLFYWLVGAVLILRFALQGLGEKVKPLISSIIELVLKLIFVVVIIPLMGYDGVIITEPIIWVFMLTQLLIAYFRHPYIKEIKEGIQRAEV